jgi:uncharacterized repeat protein (TIGR03803 family)
MSASGKTLGAYCFEAIKLTLIFVISLWFAASASRVYAQSIQTLFSFNITNGASPEAALTLGPDGNFYGTTWEGGSSADYGVSYGYGTVFCVTTNGLLTMLVSFSDTTNGANPEAAVTLGNDGNFYGTTFYGPSSYNSYGELGDGTIFQMTTNGALTTLGSFDYYNGEGGAYPRAALTLGKDGNFYGTTAEGGADDEGTVFQMTAKGTGAG